MAEMGKGAQEWEIMNRYNKTTDNLEVIEGILKDIDQQMRFTIPPWKTGFPRLDDKLDGGFMGGELIFLGAVSSLGKTSFALQMAAQMAERGRDVLIFSLEMSKKELNAKMISRYTHVLADVEEERYRLTVRDILKGEVGDLAFKHPNDKKAAHFMRAVEAVQKISGHIHIYVGENNVSVDTVEEVVKAHYMATGTKPFVVLDYLQILKPSDATNMTDKRLLTDYDVTRLKVIARDNDIPVLVISAFNRTSYLEPVSMSSFRESSGIEYSSDVLIGMQYQGMGYYKHWVTDKSGKPFEVYESEKDHNIRVRGLLDEREEDGANGKELPIELKILKHRTSAKGTLYYHFLPAYNNYLEMDKSSYKYVYRKYDDGMSGEVNEDVEDQRKRYNIVGPKL